MRVGVCGLGTVGSGLFKIFQHGADEIGRKTAAMPQLVQVGCRRDHPDCDLTATNVTRDIFDVARNPEVDILVELIGGTDVAKDLVLEAIGNGKHIVTANKALIALHGDEVFAAADRQGVTVRYEASIAGGIPIVKAIREGLAGNRINWLAGIINGTSNFILSEMSRPGSNRSFEDVLKEAQALGYAEADPTFDVEGIDAAHKLTILASIAFGIPLNFPALFTEGISRITSADIEFARELGYRIRHLGIGRRLPDGVELRVHPALVKNDQMLAQVDGVMNAVMVGSDAAGPTLYYGAGAGAGPTASAVMADIIDLS
ncbi:MAG: homoserine dehydrogenase, partial [Pseudomonadales bacterium]